jgi:hypothetical protein
MYYEKLNQILMEQDSLLTMQVKAVALKYQTGESSQLEQIMSITRKEEFQQMIRQNQTAMDMERKKPCHVALQIKRGYYF